MILLYSSAEANFSISENTEFKIEFLDMIAVRCFPPKIYFSQININDYNIVVGLYGNN